MIFAVFDLSPLTMCVNCSFITFTFAVLLPILSRLLIMSINATFLGRLRPGVFDILALYNLDYYYYYCCCCCCCCCWRRRRRRPSVVRRRRVGLKCPSVRLYVCPSTKSFLVLDFNEILYVGRGRRLMHDGMLQYDPIQGQDHEPLKVRNSAILKAISSPIYIGGWQMTMNS